MLSEAFGVSLWKSAIKLRGSVESSKMASAAPASYFAKAPFRILPVIQNKRTFSPVSLDLKGHEASFAGGNLQGNAACFVDFQRDAGDPFTGALEAEARLEPDAGRGLRVDLRRLITCLVNTVVVDQFDHPSLGVAIDLILNGIAGKLDRQELS